MKTLKQILEVYSPKSADEKRFVKKHITVKTADVAGNGDDVYSGAKVKEIDRKATRKGYNTADSEAVYEDASPPKHYGGKGVQGAKFDAYMAQRKRELEKSRPTTAKEEVDQINEIGDTPAGRRKLSGLVAAAGSRSARMNDHKPYTVKSTGERKMAVRNRTREKAWGSTKGAIDRIKHHEKQNPGIISRAVGAVKKVFSREEIEYIFNECTLEDIENFIMSEDFEAFDDSSKEMFSAYLEEHLLNEIGDTPAGRKLLKKVDKRAFYMGGTKKGGKANMADAGEKTLQRTAARLKKEEIEQIDELGKKTLKSYVKKATKVKNHPDELASRASHIAGQAHQATTQKSYDKKMAKANKLSNKAYTREVGIDRAQTRLKKEEVEMNEVLKVSGGAGEWIKDFESSKNPKFAGKSKEQRKQQALAAYYSAKRAGKE